MKKLVSLFLLLTLPILLFAEKVEVDQASLIAKIFIAEQSSLKSTDIDKDVVLSDYLSYGDQHNPELFIFKLNLDNKKSYVVMPTDDRVQPILAYSLDGWVGDSPEDFPPAMKEYLDSYSAQIKYIIDNDLSGSQLAVDQWENYDPNGSMDMGTDNSSVPPLLSTTWNQGCYYNEQCPADASGPCGHVYAGCVATAMGQVMKYHSYPSTGVGSHGYNSSYGYLEADFGNTNYNWAAMPNSISASNTEIAQLLSHLGISIDMQYSPSGSGAYSTDARNALVNYFQYDPSAVYLQRSNYSETDWEAMLKVELALSQPLMYRGSGSGGHSFVCDGYDENNMFHFNWGWSGSYNGYFSLSDLTPGSGDFTNYQAAIFHIKPLNTLSVPQNLVAQLNGDGIDLSWEAPNFTNEDGTFLGYNIYRNGLFLIGSNNLNFTDHAIQTGNQYNYTVRARYDNGESRPSNTATVTLESAVNIPDQNFKTVLNEHLGYTAPESETHNPTDYELSTITDLNAYNRGITDITGAEYLVNCLAMDFGSNSILAESGSQNGDPYNGMDEVEMIDSDPRLSYEFTIPTPENYEGEKNDLSNFSVLAGLTQLTHLYINNTGCSDIGFLSGLINLTDLYIGYNSITNISVLANLSGLRNLSLNSNPISDISPISGLANLYYLSNSYNNISDLSYVSTLTNLQYLYVYGNGINNLAPIQNLNNLSRLGISSNNITDASLLVNKTSLVRLYMGNNPIGDLSFLNNLTQLTGLDIYGYNLSNFSYLSNLINLTYLRISNNNFKTLEGVEIFTHVYQLNVDGNPLCDIRGVENLPLVYAFFHNNQITDFTPLLNNPHIMDGINRLYLENNPASKEAMENQIPALQAVTTSYGNWPTQDDRAACYPTPENNADTISDASLLEWQANFSQTSGLTYNVYLGTDAYEQTLVAYGLSSLNFDPELLAEESYWWRVETIDGQDTLRSGVWNFNTNSEASVNIPDLNFKIVLNEHLGYVAPETSTHNPTAEELATIVDLNAANRGITDITGAEYLVNCLAISFDNNAIFTDGETLDNSLQNDEGIERLEDQKISYNFTMPTIESEGIDNYELSSLTALEGLTQLQHLSLYNTGCSDINFLSGLVNLTELTLWRNNISDISVLENLTNLTYLDLDENNISDITALSSLTNITIIYLSFNSIINIVPLSSLINLVGLPINSNNVTDITAISTLTNLTYLNIGDNNITDMSICASLSNLIRLYIGDNPSNDLSFLNTMTQLTSLGLDNLGLNDFGQIQNLTNLTYLNISDNNFYTLEGIENYTSLSQLNAYRNPALYDIRGMETLPLNYVYLYENSISDFSPLLDNPNIMDGIYRLYLENNLASKEAIEDQIPALQAVTTYGNWPTQDDRVACFPIPENEADTVSVDALLEWQANFGQTAGITYDVYLGTEAFNQTIVAQGLTNMSFDPDLIANEKYWWRVESIINGDSIRSGVWSFNTLSNTGVNIPDLNFKRVLNEHLGYEGSEAETHTPTTYELSTIEGLNAGREGITDIAGAEYLVNCKFINMANNDLFLDGGFMGQDSLIDVEKYVNWKMENPTTDQATGEEGIDIANISALSGLTQLEMINLCGTGCDDLSFLSELTNLTDLLLGSNNISDVSPIANLSKLRLLTLDQNNISDISAFSSLTKLQALLMDFNQVSDATALSNLSYLDIVILENNLLTNLNAFSSLVGLEVLSVFNNPINDLDPIQNLTNLHFLNVGLTNITDFSSLPGMTSITGLHIGHNSITDLSFLNSMTQLTNLFVDGIGLNNLDALQNLSNLTYVNLSGNDLLSTEGIESLPLLTSLDVTWNSLYDIRGLENLPLNELRLHNNQITDFSPLLNNSDIMDGIGWLYIENNPASKEAVEDQISALQAVTAQGNWPTQNDLAACFPVPGNVADTVSVDALLEWEANFGQTAGLTYDVYLGTNAYDQPLVGQGLSSLNFDPELGINEDYWWRVESVLNGDTVRSAVWNFNTSTSASVNIPDLNFKIVLNEHLGYVAPETETHNPTAEELATIVDLNAYNRGITDITGAEYLVNCLAINLANNSIFSDNQTDGSELSIPEGLNGEDEIQRIKDQKQSYDYTIAVAENESGESNELNDFSALEGLTQLEHLEIYNTGCNDLGFLANLSNLIYLDLDQNNLSDISILSNLTKLEILFLNHNNISDINALSNLTDLTYLYLRSNNVSDISPLSNLINIDYLHLGYNSITDISALSNLTKLEILYLYHNNIIDIGALSSLAKIEVLYLYNNNILEISSLSNLVSLKSLSLHDNVISDVSSLSNLLNLTYLGISYNDITNMGMLSSMTNLGRLSIGFNPISDLSFLNNLVQLNNLAIHGLDLKDLSQIENLINLNYLYIYDNNFITLEGIENFPNLIQLSAHRNPALYDIRGIENLPLNYVYLYESGITDFTPLLNNPNVMDGIYRLSLENNPASKEAVEDQIPALQAVTTYGNWPTQNDSAACYPVPINDADTVSADVILEWQANFGQTSGLTYDVYLGTEAYNQPLVAQGLSALSFDPDLVANEKYWWRVESIVNGDTIRSGVWKFNTYSNAAVNIPDQNFKIVLNEHLGFTAPESETHNPTVAELATIADLNANNRGITDIKGAEYLVNCLAIDLGNNSIYSDNEVGENISVVNNGLELNDSIGKRWMYQFSYPSIELNEVDQNELSNLSALEGLTQLEYLYLNNTGITDLEFVSGLSNLVFLNLGYNGITELSPLSSLINLEGLRLYRNYVLNSLSGIEGLTNLDFLDVSNNDISDLSALSGLVNLEILYAYGNDISDIGSLSSLIKLEILSFAGNTITDLNPISNLTTLQRIYATDNGISNLSPILGLNNLWLLDIGLNNVSDFGLLASMSNLEYLYLGSNPINDLSFLNNMTQLRGIGVDNLNLSNLDYIKNLINLRNLGIPNNNFTNLQGIENLQFLVEIQAQGNHLYDIRGIENLPLESVFLFDNQVTDFTPLLDNPSVMDGISELFVEDNPASKEAIEDQIPALQAVTTYGNWPIQEDMAPCYPIPQNGPSPVSNAIQLQWQANFGQTAGLTYDVYLGSEAYGQPMVAQGLSNLNFDPEIIEDENYWWRIESIVPGDTIRSGVWSFNTSTHSLETDSLALVALYNATDGPNWTDNTNWLTGSVSTWYGVTVENNRVTQLRLTYNNLNGIIPANFFELTSLEELVIRYESNLTGNIPSEISNLKNLIELDLSGNNFSGSIPQGIKNLNNITYLNLRYNYFDGASFPEWVTEMVGLQSLYLCGNNINGSLPQSLLNLTQLKDLWIENNGISGEFPIWLSQMTDLETLIIGGNSFSGEIPVEWGSLINLRSISFHRSDLTQFPLWVLSLTNIGYLSLGDNLFSGGIPSEIGDLINLYGLNLYSNNFTGEIPSGISNLSNLSQLDLSNNSLEGFIPSEFTDLARLRKLGLSGNNFCGNLPELKLVDNLLMNSDALIYRDDENDKTLFYESYVGSEEEIDSAPDNIRDVYVHDNNFNFTNIAASGILPGDIDRFYYAPQNRLPAPIVTDATGGKDLFVFKGHDNNVYTWYQNDTELISGSDSILFVPDGNYGLYYCAISNSLYPDLILETDTVRISAIDDELSALFGADVLSGTFPLTVQFTDSSSGNPTEWAWDFDNDGHIDCYNQNPEWAYADTGIYTVSLYVRNESLIDSLLKTNYISVSKGEMKNVALAANGAKATASSYGSYMGYNATADKAIDGLNYTPWYGTSVPDWLMIEFDQIYLIDEIGLYSSYNTQTINVEISTDGQSWITVISSFTTSNNIPSGQDESEYRGFEISPQNAKFLRANFTYSDAYPSHIYKCGLNEITAYCIDVSGEELDANFISDITEGISPLTVQFADSSSGNPTTWAWDFDNDGNIDSYDQNPDWTYADTGTYSVSLTIGDGTNTDTETKVDYIRVNPFGIPSGWTVNPSDYAFEGEVIAEVFIDDDTTGAGILAAFVDGVCRGVMSEPQWGPTYKLIYIMRVYSNQASGENIEFKFLENSENGIMDIQETIPFTSDMTIGSAIAPFEMNAYSFLEFSKSMTAGWNWFSIYLESDSMALDQILSTLNPQAGDYIKDRKGTGNSSTFYDQSGFRGWFGTLSSLDPKETYKIKLNNAGEMTYQGLEFDFENEQIPVNAGWNWIGYPLSGEMSVSDYLGSLTKVANDYIKDQLVSSTFYDGYGWYGQLSMMQPGNGYVLKVGNSGFINSAGFSALKSTQTTIPRWSKIENPAYVLNVRDFEFSGSALIEVFVESISSGSETNILYAFNQDEICIGIANAMYYPMTDKYLYNLMMYSNAESGDEIHFKYYESKLDKWYVFEERLSFESDMVISNAYQPFELKSVIEVVHNQLENIPLKVYPNPFNDDLNCHFWMNENGWVRISIINSIGEPVSILADRNFSYGMHRLNWNESGLKPGVYYLRFLKKNFEKTIPLVKMH